MKRGDPIQSDTFNIRRGREANPERMRQIRHLAKRKAMYGELLHMQIREAIRTGHSYRQVAEASGVSTTTIQRIVTGGEE